MYLVRIYLRKIMLCAEDKFQCHNTQQFLFTNFLTLSYIIEFQPSIAMHVPDRGYSALISTINESVTNISSRL